MSTGQPSQQEQGCRRWEPVAAWAPRMWCTKRYVGCCRRRPHAR